MKNEIIEHNEILNVIKEDEASKKVPESEEEKMLDGANGKAM